MEERRSGREMESALGRGWGGGEGGYLCLSVSSAAGRLLKGSLVAGEPTGRTQGAAVGGKTG